MNFPSSVDIPSFSLAVGSIRHFTYILTGYPPFFILIGTFIPPE